MATTKPKQLSPAEVATMTTIQTGAMPTLAPPKEQSSDGVTAWVNDQRVVGLWTINENRNVWVYVNNVGWKKLANGSDSAVTALTILSAHAKQMQSVYSYREEGDGMIHEAYVW